MKLRSLAQKGNTIVGTLTPENISMGSSNIVNRNAESLENRNIEFKNIPHIIAKIIIITKTIQAAKKLILKYCRFVKNTINENTAITHTLSNSEESAFPKIIPNLFAGDRYINSKVPYILSKEKFHADCTSDLKKLMHIYPKSININRFFSFKYPIVLLFKLKGLKLK